MATGLSSVVTKTDQISEWTRSYSVRTSNPSELVDIDGSRLSKEFSYEITLGVRGTGTVTNFIASLTSNSAANGWTLTIHESSGTSSNHPYVYLDSSGNPMVSLYGHTTYYLVVATVKKLASRSQTSLTMLSNNINLRVVKGDVMSQINVEAGRTLIQSGKVLINASSTTITGTAFIDGAVMKTASMDGAVIKNATIASAKIANLDVSKIVGNTTNFVTSAWNAGSNSVTLDASGMYMVGSGTWRRSYLSATGFDLYNGQGGGGKAGVIGYFKEHADSANSSENFISLSSKGGNHYIGIAANPSHNIVLGHQKYTAISNRYFPSISINGVDGLIRIHEAISSAGSGYTMNVTAYDGNQGMYGVGFTSSGGGIILGANGTWLWQQSTSKWVRF